MSQCGLNTAENVENMINVKEEISNRRSRASDPKNKPDEIFKVLALHALRQTATRQPAGF
jgi:hypothetical protein